MSRFKSLLLCAALFCLGFAAQASSSETITSIQAQQQPTVAQPAPVPPTPLPAAVTQPAQPLPGPEQRVALVIGNSNYQNTQALPNPDNDAQSMAQFLNSAGFEVIAATDLSQNDMIRVVQDFSAKVAERGPNTVAMVYYAGHGVQLAGENYLIPVDAKISTPDDLASNAVRLVDVMATLQAIPSRLRIVVLDACRNNPFPNIDDAGRGLAIVDAPAGSIVGYSTAPGAEALDGSGGHSPYTSAFLRLAHEPNQPIETLFKRIRLEVNAVAATRAPVNAPVVQMASNLPSRSVRQVYDYVVSEGSPDYYQEFIIMFPYDPLCERIRHLLWELREAAAWHQAVLANSPFAYKAFYEHHNNSPYAQAALHLQSQPKTMPLSQPTHLLNGGVHLPVQSGPSKVVTMPAPGKDIGAGNGVGKIVTLPAGNNGKVTAGHEIKTIDAVKHVDLPSKPREHVEAHDSGTFKRVTNAPARMGGGFGSHFAMGGGGGFGGHGRR
jgi:Caspase domain